MNRDWVLFWKLHEPEHLKIRAFCRKLSGNRDDGDDLYQDSLVIALTKFSGLREESAFRPWLYRIVINQFRNRFRRSWWQRQIETLSESTEPRSGQDLVAQSAARRRLEHAFSPLIPYDRALVTLFEMEGWSIGDLSRMTGKSEGSIKVRLSRSRRKMRAALTRYLAQPDRRKRIVTKRSEDEICVVAKPSTD